MRDWLQYFFLSFFTDKYTQEAHKRSLLNAFGCYFLSLAILLCLLMGGYMAAMPSHYHSAKEYRQAVYAVLGDSERIAKKENGFFSFTDAQNSPAVINTFRDQKNDVCEIIVDTRDIKNIFVEFTVQYTNEEGIQLSYEAYLSLAEEEKAAYTFSANYTDTPIEFSDDLLASYEQYLTAFENEEIQAQFTELLAKKPELERSAYVSSLYELYVKAYYPADVISLDLYSFAPTLYTYYEHLTAQAGDSQFFAMYRDLIYARFAGDGDIRYLISGVSGEMEDRLVSAQDAGTTQAAIDRLIADAFRSSAQTILIEYIFNFVKLSSLLILGSLLLAALPWLLFKATKNPKLSAYFTSFQILYLYTPMAAVIGGLVGFALSWSVSRSAAYRAAAICYIAVVVCRLTIYTIRTLYREKARSSE